jgi:hypothetical protein
MLRDDAALRETAMKRFDVADRPITGYETIGVTRLTPTIGATLDGIDLSRPISEQQLSEVQQAALTSFTTNGQQFVLRYNGADSAPIVRGTNFTTARHLNSVSRFNTGWNFDINCLASAYSTIARTFPAWVRNCGTVSPAIVTRTRCHYLTNKRSSYLLSFAATLTDRTCLRC